MNCSGGSPVEGWTAVNIAMVPFLTLAGRGFDLARHAATSRLSLFRTACSNADFIQNRLDPCGGRGRCDLRL